MTEATTPQAPDEPQVMTNQDQVEPYKYELVLNGQTIFASNDLDQLTDHAQSYGDGLYTVKKNLRKIAVVTPEPTRRVLVSSTDRRPRAPRDPSAPKVKRSPRKKKNES